MARDRSEVAGRRGRPPWPTARWLCLLIRRRARHAGRPMTRVGGVPGLAAGPPYRAFLTASTPPSFVCSVPSAGMGRTREPQLPQERNGLDNPPGSVTLPAAFGFGCHGRLVRPCGLSGGRVEHTHWQASCQCHPPVSAAPSRGFPSYRPCRPRARFASPWAIFPRPLRGLSTVWGRLKCHAPNAASGIVLRIRVGP